MTYLRNANNNKQGHSDYYVLKKRRDEMRKVIMAVMIFVLCIFTAHAAFASITLEDFIRDIDRRVETEKKDKEAKEVKRVAGCQVIGEDAWDVWDERAKRDLLLEGAKVEHSIKYYSCDNGNLLVMKYQYTKRGVLTYEIVWDPIFREKFKRYKINPNAILETSITHYTAYDIPSRLIFKTDRENIKKGDRVWLWIPFPKIEKMLISVAAKPINEWSSDTLWRMRKIARDFEGGFFIIGDYTKFENAFPIGRKHSWVGDWKSGILATYVKSHSDYDSVFHALMEIPRQFRGEEFRNRLRAAVQAGRDRGMVGERLNFERFEHQVNAIRVFAGLEKLRGEGRLQRFNKFDESKNPLSSLTIDGNIWHTAFYTYDDNKLFVAAMRWDRKKCQPKSVVRFYAYNISDGKLYKVEVCGKIESSVSGVTGTTDLVKPGTEVWHTNFPMNNDNLRKSLLEQWNAIDNFKNASDLKLWFEDMLKMAIYEPYSVQKRYPNAYKFILKISDDKESAKK